MVKRFKFNYMKYLLLAIILLPSLINSQRVAKEVTTDGAFKNVTITIGYWNHHYRNDTLVGSWYETDSIKYNYGANGELIFKEVTQGDTTYYATPINYAWSVEWTKIKYEVKEYDEVIEIVEITGPVNLFSIDDEGIELGYYIGYNNGLALSNANYNASGYIAVESGKEYSISYKHQVAWYDSDKVYLSGSNSTDADNNQTAPAGAFYLRCSILSSEFNNFEVLLTN